MIIAVLAGMMLIATGASTDSAEATKIIGDLRGLKGAATMFYFNEKRWPVPGDDDDVEAINEYCDRPMSDRYFVEIVEYASDRLIIGVTLDLPINRGPGIKRKLESKAMEAGLLNRHGSTYKSDADGDTVFMHLK